MTKPRKSTVLGVLLVVFGSLQLFQPEAPSAVLPGDGVMSDHLQVPEDVEILLRRACYDCHSGDTRWPWYSRVAPLSWIIVRDVQHGRSNLDFSSWSRDLYVEPTPEQRLRWMCRDIREGIMPPRLYRLAHPETRLSADDKDVICSWSARAVSGLDAVSEPAR